MVISTRGVGRMANGKEHGKGVYTSANGDKYEGGFENGERHGKGVCTDASGIKYEGGFENCERHGKEVEKKWVHKVGTYIVDGVKKWKFLGSWHGW
jgi:hypothetical protein